MRRWTIQVNERELRAILHALDIARDQTVNDGWRWFTDTQYVDRLKANVTDPTEYPELYL